MRDYSEPRGAITHECMKSFDYSNKFQKRHFPKYKGMVLSTSTSCRFPLSDFVAAFITKFDPFFIGQAPLPTKSALLNGSLSETLTNARAEAAKNG